MPITTTGAGVVTGGGGPPIPSTGYFPDRYFAPVYFTNSYFP